MDDADLCPYCNSPFETCVCDFLPQSITIASNPGEVDNLAAFLGDDEILDLGVA